MAAYHCHLWEAVFLKTKIHYSTTTEESPKRPRITYTQELQQLLMAKALRLISEMSEMQLQSSQITYNGSVIQSRTK